MYTIIELENKVRERANLAGANLVGANLAGAYYDSRTRWPAISIVLLASWGEVSNELTRDLMRYDAAMHPDPSAFDQWVKGGACPLNEILVGRAASFVEKRHLWSPGPVKPYGLFERLLAEKLVKV